MNRTIQQAVMAIMAAGILAGAGKGDDSVVLSPIKCNLVSGRKVHSTALPAPDGKPVEQIAFLFLRLKDDVITLDDMQITNGRLKLPKEHRIYDDKIQYELLSGTGIVVHAGSIDNPLVKRLEYEDPEKPGHLKMHLVEEKEASFMLRIPWTKDMKQIRFQRWKAGAPPPPGTLRGESGKIGIGTINLSPLQETP